MSLYNEYIACGLDTYAARNNGQSLVSVHLSVMLVVTTAVEEHEEVKKLVWDFEQMVLRER